MRLIVIAACWTVVAIALEHVVDWPSQVVVGLFSLGYISTVFWLNRKEFRRQAREATERRMTDGRRPRR